MSGARLEIHLSAGPARDWKVPLFCSVLTVDGEGKPIPYCPVVIHLEGDGTLSMDRPRRAKIETTGPDGTFVVTLWEYPQEQECDLASTLIVDSPNLNARIRLTPGF